MPLTADVRLPSVGVHNAAQTECAEACRICDSTEGNRDHAPCEMQFGSRESFDYLEGGRGG